MAKPRTVRPIDQKTAAAEPKPLDPVTDFDTPLRKEQADLPGMENRAIEELEDAARRYAAIRDKRMALNDAEVKLKDLLLGLLKKHGRREYKRDGIEVWIKVEEETVKVKVTEDDEDRPPSTRKGKNSESISKQAESRGAASTGEGATSQREQAPDEADRKNHEVEGQGSATTEPREPGSDDF